MLVHKSPVSCGKPVLALPIPRYCVSDRLQSWEKTCLTPLGDGTHSTRSATAVRAEPDLYPNLVLDLDLAIAYLIGRLTKEPEKRSVLVSEEETESNSSSSRSTIEG